MNFLVRQESKDYHFLVFQLFCFRVLINLILKMNIENRGLSLPTVLKRIFSGMYTAIFTDLVANSYEPQREILKQQLLKKKTFKINFFKNQIC